MFGIGGPELIVILVLALLFIGPEKLPQVAKTVGTGLRDLRRAANLAQAELSATMTELQREVEKSVDLADKREELNKRREEKQVLADHAAAASEAAEQAVAAPEAQSEPSRDPTLQGPPADGETLAVIPRNAPPAPFSITPAAGAVSRPARLVPEAAEVTEAHDPSKEDQPA